MSIAKANLFVTIVEGDLLLSSEDILAHQTNCLGIMGGGIALQIKNKYPNVFKQYREFCLNRTCSEKLLGECQIVKIENEPNRYIANLFGQFEISRTSVQTREDCLEKALIILKNEAQRKDLSVGIPYKIGCGLAGGNWDNVYQIISRVFYDYPVTIYKIP